MTGRTRGAWVLLWVVRLWGAAGPGVQVARFDANKGAISIRGLGPSIPFIATGPQCSLRTEIARSR